MGDTGYPSLIFCLSSETYSPSFLVAWSELLGHCISKNIRFAISHNYDKNPYFCKNNCLGGEPQGGKGQVPFGGVKYDRVMWLDNGINFSLEDFDKLLNSDKDVISGMYMAPNNKTFMACETMDPDYLQNNKVFDFITQEKVGMLIKENKVKPFKVEYSGMGFTMLKAGVLEKIGYPWFYPAPIEFSECGDFYPEDISLFKKFKEAGVECWVDPTIIVGFEKKVNLLPYSLKQ